MRRSFRSASLLLTPIVAAGCSLSIGGQLDELDTDLTTPSLVGVSEPCVPAAGLAVNGSRPANTRVIALITPTTGPSTEVELAPLGAETTWNGTLTVGNAEGDYAVAVVAENAGGTRSNVSTEVALRVDRTAPGAPTGTFPTTAAPNSTLSVTLTTDDDVESIACGAGSSVVAAGDTFEASFTIAADTNTFACIATDTCGLTSSPTAVSILGETPDQLATPTATAPADVRLAAGETTATVALVGSAEGADTVLIAVDDEVLPAVNVDDDDFATDLELELGPHTVEIIANSNDASILASEPLVLEATVLDVLAAPTFTCPATPTNLNQLALAGTRVDGTAIELVVGAEPATVLDDGTGTSWTGTVDVTARADGAFAFALVARDEFGVSAPAACTVTLDRAAPGAIDLDPIIATIARTSTSGEVTFRGTGEPGATLTAGLDGAALVAVGTVEPDGTFAVALVVTTTTTSITVVQTDAAGNASTPTTETFIVTQQLPPPVLTSPARGSFPLRTNASTLTLVGTKVADTGIGLRPTTGGADVILSPIDGLTSFSSAFTLPQNTSTSFCLFQFNVVEASPLLCRGSTTATPFIVEHDNIAPAAPVITVDSNVQTATVLASIAKEAGTTLTFTRNGGVATAEPTATAVTTFAKSLALDLGNTEFCFVQRDVAGNDSDEACVTIRRTEAGLDIESPTTFAVVNGTALRVEATMADTIATSYEICVTTPPVATPACQTASGADIDANGRLAKTITLATAPAAATIATVEICGTDGRLADICASRQIVLQAAPQRLSTSQTDETKSSSQLVIDDLGFVHLVWTDGEDCTTGHSDVIRAVSRVGTTRLTVQVDRTDVNFANDSTFEIFGTRSYDGIYAVQSYANGVITTKTGRPTGDPESAGNINTTAPGACNASDIFYARFDDAGWSRILNLSDVGGDAISTLPTLAVDDDGDVHVAWVEAGNLDPVNGLAKPPQSPADGTTTDIVHRVIDGLTGAISKAVVVSKQDDVGNAFVNDTAPSLAAGPDGVVIAWDAARRVLLSRFDPATSTWSTPGVVFNGVSTAAPTTPAVAVGPSGTTYVAWVDNGGRALASGTVGTSGDRDIVVCPVFPQQTSCLTNADVLVSRGADTGNSIEPAVYVTADGAESIHVVWSDNEGRDNTQRRILHQRLYLSGVRVFGATTAVTSSGNAAAPVISGTPGTNEIIVAWVDNSGANRPPFVLTSVLGVDSEEDSEGFAQTVVFGTPGLVFNGGGTVASTERDPSMAVGDGRTVWFGVTHFVGSTVGEIFVYPTNY